MTKQNMIETIKRNERTAWREYKENLEKYGKDERETLESGREWYALYKLCNELGIN